MLCQEYIYGEKRTFGILNQIYWDTRTLSCEIHKTRTVLGKSDEWDPYAHTTEDTGVITSDDIINYDNVIIKYDMYEQRIMGNSIITLLPHILDNPLY
jgi:hypothetical protein